MNNIKVKDALVPIGALIIIMIFGLAIFPSLQEGNSQISLEIIFLAAAVVGTLNLVRLGYSWASIQDAMVKKLHQALPAIMILFSIGIVVGSWVLSGTIPFLIYHGINLINPSYIYAVAFVVPSIFSLFTGTSWGSAGTIGVVIMAIAIAIGANPVMVAGAVVGGAYFGDKMSPLSDTTNIAALAAGVPLMEHIRSMMNTTVPSYLIAFCIYLSVGFYQPIANTAVDLDAVQATQAAFSSLFAFDHPILIIFICCPILIVLIGSIIKAPTVPTLIVSVIVASLVGLFGQGFSLDIVASTLKNGFNAESFLNISQKLSDQTVINNTIRILNRGGLYSMAEPVIITMSVFVFVGTLDKINALPIVVNHAFGWVKNRSLAIISALFSTAATNALTSNQFATSFVVAEAFKPKFDELKIPRKVLSRTLEDAGTMIENILPWTTTGVYMFSVLGVSAAEYWKYQYLTQINLVIAVILAITGLGCFYNETRKNNTKIADKASIN
ncbi:Na+/H+ antiporter [Gammaproteobacteria bacterium]|nr:Na+/H+ antiporter [Gammaproteobacteria bacterium]